MFDFVSKLIAKFALDRVPVVCLTGGPMAGKTTCLEALKLEFGDRILIIPEVATLLLAGGFPVPGRDLPISDEWLDLFQSAVAPTQTAMEQAFQLTAQHRPSAELIICDRGILDGSAYIPGGKKRFLEAFQIDEPTALALYDQIILLETLARSQPDRFGTAGNAQRYENAAEACALQARLGAAWANHPNQLTLNAGRGIEAIVQTVLTEISQRIDQEIERRWKLDSLPTFDLGPAAAIEQGYLVNTHTSELRLRRIGDQVVITSKDTGAAIRGEWERGVPQSVFDRHWPDIVGQPIRKHRYYIEDGNGRIELDIYDEWPLIMIEREFRTPAQAAAYQLPAWTQTCHPIEVTNDPRYKNKHLARFGPPELAPV